MFFRLFISAVVLAAFSVSSHGAPVLESVHSFALPPIEPLGQLVVGADGNLYGTSRSGGAFRGGCIFRVTPAGQVSSFVSLNTDTGSPLEALILTDGLTIGADGDFYAMTCNSNGSEGGKILRITPQGELSIFHELAEDTGFPASRLTLAPDGNFYGCTSNRIFRLTPASEYSVLVELDGTTGTYPYTALTVGPDGALYGGTTFVDSEMDPHGSLFRVTTSGEFSLLTKSPRPMQAPLTAGPDGFLYGGYPFLFRLDSHGEFLPLSTRSAGSLVQGADGALYGFTSSETLEVSFFRYTPSTGITLLQEQNDVLPVGLIQGPDGSFYGTAPYGYSNANSPYYRSGIGRVIKISLTGQSTVLAEFGTDAANTPGGPPVQQRDGSFLLTAREGGLNNEGAIVKVTPDGVATILHSFQNPLGKAPSTGLVAGRDGNFYGTTSEGGYGGGTFFRVTSKGAFSSLASLGNGFGSVTELLAASDGNFYGISSNGSESAMFKVSPRGKLEHFDVYPGGTGLAEGAGLTFYGCLPFVLGHGPLTIGNLFKITSKGDFTLLPAFPGGKGPDEPSAALTPAPDGGFYGTSRYGGENLSGTVYHADPAGHVTLVASMPISGYGGPDAKLLLAADGNLYGTSSRGGDHGYGSIFRVTPGGVCTTLHQFEVSDGSYPSGGLIQGEDGHLYGTTQEGGLNPQGIPSGGGELFRLRLGARAVPLPASAITATGATLEGTVDPSDYDTTYAFQISPEPRFLRPTTLGSGTVAAGSPMNVTARAPRLLPNRTYWFRLVTRNAENPVQQISTALSFKTLRATSLRDVFEWLR